jgi:cytochrome c556
MLVKKMFGLASLVVVVMPTLALTDEATTLKSIMLGLRDGLVEISDGLLTDDFGLVQHGATTIAEHPRIPAEQVQLVAQELGEEMAAFKALDTRVHDLSLEIEAAAKVLDGAAARAAFTQMVDGCFACHAAYKERVAAVLNETS